MEIVVRLRPETARGLQGGSPDDVAVARLTAVLSEVGAELTPQHPGIVDPTLQSYYTVTGLSDEDAHRVAAALRELDEVEAAYEQPPPSPA
jgi:hypothetical protein